jgi:hypothetical protein
MLAHLQQRRKPASQSQGGILTAEQAGDHAGSLAAAQKASKPEPGRNINSRAGWGPCWLTCRAAQKASKPETGRDTYYEQRRLGTMLAHLQQLQQKASKPELGRNTYYEQSRLGTILAYLQKLQQKASKPEPGRNTYYE